MFTIYEFILLYSFELWGASDASRGGELFVFYDFDFFQVDVV